MKALHTFRFNVMLISLAASFRRDNTFGGKTVSFQALCPELTDQLQCSVLLSLSNSENQSLGIYAIWLQ